MTPGLIISAPRSGAGKTTVMLGLLRCLAEDGVAVQPYKCGPDYIDPAFHRAACGRDSFNLDSWAMPDALLQAQLTRGGDMALAEGSMGLFDGVAFAGETGTGASADIAARTGWPVVLVLDASGAAQTMAAVAAGMGAFRADVRLAGVILNRMASPRHERLCRLGMETVGIPVLGALPRRGDLTLPERHLGLVQAVEHPDLQAAVAQYAAFLRQHVDLSALRAAATCRLAATGHLAPAADPGPAALLRQPAELSAAHAPHEPEHPADSSKAGVGFDGSAIAVTGEGRTGDPPSTPPATPAAAACLSTQTSRASGSGNPAASPRNALPPPPARRIALARDAAFSFVYPHLLDSWHRQGAEILPFSPLADEAPPEADLCWLPGGYPELHAGRIAAAGRFLAGLRQFARTRPVHGECGGYMVLGAALVDAQGTSHAMAGLLGLVTSYEKRRMHLGYRLAELAAPLPGLAAGTRLRGHEFHYSTILSQPDAPLARVTDAEGAEVHETGSRRDHVSGTFFHLIARAS